MSDSRVRCCINNSWVVSFSAFGIRGCHAVLFVFLVWVSLLGITKFCLRLRQDLLFFSGPLRGVSRNSKVLRRQDSGNKKKTGTQTWLAWSVTSKSLGCIWACLSVAIPFLASKRVTKVCHVLLRNTGTCGRSSLRVFCGNQGWWSWCGSLVSHGGLPWQAVDGNHWASAAHQLLWL